LPNTNFIDGLKAVATKLITGFGSSGLLIVPATEDEVTGETIGEDSETAVLYHREYLTGRELIGSFVNGNIADRVKAGDAMITVVFDQEVSDTWKFEDDDQEVWNIISVKPSEAQGKDAIYELHIRK